MSTTCPDHRPYRQRGFSIVAAIFILVVLAGLGGFIVSVSTTQSLSFAQDVQGTRAYQAARTGIEWGVHRWLALGTCSGTTPVTFTNPDLSAFTVQVATTQIAGGGMQFCEIVATATTGGAAGSVGYIERQLRAVVEGN